MRAEVVTAAILLALTSAAVTAPKLKPVKQVNATNGLTGSGTGPTVNLGVAPGGITSNHIQDGTLDTGDFSLAARTALKGDKGDTGLTGPPGMMGLQGVPGPPGAAPQSEVMHLVVTESINLPEGDRPEYAIPELTTTFEITEPRVLRAYINVVGGFSGDWLRLKVNGVPMGAAVGDFARIYRVMKLPPGTHTVSASVMNIANGNVWILGMQRYEGPNGPGTPMSYMDLELQ